MLLCVYDVGGKEIQLRESSPAFLNGTTPAQTGRFQLKSGEKFWALTYNILNGCKTILPICWVVFSALIDFYVICVYEKREFKDFLFFIGSYIRDLIFYGVIN